MGDAGEGCLGKDLNISEVNRETCILEHRKGEAGLCKDILQPEYFTMFFFVSTVKFRIVNLDENLNVIKNEVSINLCLSGSRNFSVRHIERLMKETSPFMPVKP